MMIPHSSDRGDVLVFLDSGFRRGVPRKMTRNTSYSISLLFLLHQIRRWIRPTLILPTLFLFVQPEKMAIALNVNLSTGNLSFSDGQNTMPYRLYVPPGYNTPGAEFPLIMFLHGSGESGTDNVAPSNGWIDNLYNAAHGNYGAQYKAFLLVPQTQWGWWGSSPDSIAQPLAMGILNLVSSTYQVDTQRLYVTGLSMGGGGTFNIIANHPETFAAASPLSGYGDTSSASIIKDIPIWAFHGASDTVVEVDYTDEMYDAVEAAGGHMEYTRVAGLGHSGWDTFYNGSTYKNSKNQTLYQWMFAQAKPVPEPSWIVLVSGVFGIGLLHRLRRKY
jgi:predicted peptidase